MVRTCENRFSGLFAGVQATAEGAVGYAVAEAGRLVSFGEARRRVPHINAVAVAGSTAIVHGRAAWLLGRLLAEARVRSELEGLLGRLGVPPEDRMDVARSCAALEAAGANWWIAEHGPSGSGRPDGGPAGRAASSKGARAPRTLSAREVGSLLGVCDRQVRLLAESGRLPGRRDSGGRWGFELADVEAERERRMTNQGGRRVA